LDNRHISNSILKYGHNNFSLIILEILGLSKNIKLNYQTLIDKEQYYIDLYKPKLNINVKADSMLGFKHSKKTKLFLAELRKGSNLSIQTRKRLSELFSGELNPF